MSGCGCSFCKSLLTGDGPAPDPDGRLPPLDPGSYPWIFMEAQADSRDMISHGQLGHTAAARPIES